VTLSLRPTPGLDHKRAIRSAVSGGAGRVRREIVCQAIRASDARGCRHACPGMRDADRTPSPSRRPRIHVHVVVVVGSVVVVVAVVVVTGMVVVVLGTVVVVVVRGTVVVVVAGAVVLVVVVPGADVVVVGGRVVVVAGGRVVVVVVPRIVVSGGGALDGDVATDGLLSVTRSAPPGNDEISVRDDALRPNGAWVVVIVTTAFAVVVVLPVTVVGAVLVTFARCTRSVGGAVSDAAKAHTRTPVTASAATTSTTRGCQTPSR
jgi:hypothetical protein